MEEWRKYLPVDPIPVFLNLGHSAILYHVKKDLLDDPSGVPEMLWNLPEARGYVRKQQDEGSWKYPGKTREIRSLENYDQVETYRLLRILVEKYLFNRSHPSIELAAEYFFDAQSPEGDIRGIYGNQYSANYHAGIMELLIKSGYQDDPRIRLGFEWLFTIRQADGGWAIPFRTMGMNIQKAMSADHPSLPDRSKPFSHLVTGVVLRALAAHPDWRKTETAHAAASMLADRLFQSDAYIDRGAPEYWERVSFPFWFTDIVSGLDSLSLIGLKADDPRIQTALDWLKQRQKPSGDFDLKIVRGRDKFDNFWIALAICRIFKRCYAA